MGPPTGVPPGATVTVAAPTVTVIVTVGIAITIVVVELTKVCDAAPGGGTGFGSGLPHHNQSSMRHDTEADLLQYI